ncbi:MAG: hypothetical protein JKY51_01220 [Opitutaceae bacterium]|nr:hypothetical protein [Opitutaceae bacterium]
MTAKYEGAVSRVAFQIVKAQHIDVIIHFGVRQFRTRIGKFEVTHYKLPRIVIGAPVVEDVGGRTDSHAQADRTHGFGGFAHSGRHLICKKVFFPKELQGFAGGTYVRLEKNGNGTHVRSTGENMIRVQPSYIAQSLFHTVNYVLLNTEAVPR